MLLRTAYHPLAMMLYTESIRLWKTGSSGQPPYQETKANNHTCNLHSYFSLLPCLNAFISSLLLSQAFCSWKVSWFPSKTPVKINLSGENQIPLQQISSSSVLSARCVSGIQSWKVTEKKPLWSYPRLGWGRNSKLFKAGPTLVSCNSAKAFSSILRINVNNVTEDTEVLGAKSQRFLPSLIVRILSSSLQIVPWTLFIGTAEEQSVFMAEEPWVQVHL